MGSPTCAQLMLMSGKSEIGAPFSGSAHPHSAYDPESETAAERVNALTLF